MAMKKAKTKPLARMKNTAKGSLHHIEIHPAKNSAGGQAFISKTYRNRTPEAQAAMDKGGRYMPEPDPEVVPHEDGQDMLDHVSNTLGVKPEPADDEDEDDKE